MNALFTKTEYLNTSCSVCDTSAHNYSKNCALYDFLSFFALICTPMFLFAVYKGYSQQTLFGIPAPLYYAKYTWGMRIAGHSSRLWWNVY